MVEMKEAEKLSYINFPVARLIDWLIITVSAEGSTKLLTDLSTVVLMKALLLTNGEPLAN